MQNTHLAGNGMGHSNFIAGRRMAKPLAEA